MCILSEVRENLHELRHRWRVSTRAVEERKVIHEASPALEESIKWGMPSFLYRGKIVCGFAGFKAHCALKKAVQLIDRRR